MLDLLVTGGLVVTPDGARELDVGVEGETIASLLEPGTVEEARQVLDATGKLVFPGGVEPHAHIFEPMYRGWTRMRCGAPSSSPRTRGASGRSPSRHGSRPRRRA